MAGIVHRLLHVTRAPRAAHWLAPLLLAALLFAHTGTCAALLAPTQAASETGVVCHHGSADDIDCEVPAPTSGTALDPAEPLQAVGDAWTAGMTGPSPRAVVAGGPLTPSIVAIGISRT